MKKIKAVALSAALFFLILLNIGIGLDTKSTNASITTLGVKLALAQPSETDPDHDGYPSGSACGSFKCQLECGVPPYVVVYEGTYWGCSSTDARGTCDSNLCNTRCSASCFGE